MAATRRRRNTTPEPEVVEDDAFEELDADDELEDIDQPEVVEEPAPKRRGRKPATAPKTVTPAGKSVRADTSTDNTYNSTWLAEHVSEVTGENIDSRSLRMLLRKMAGAGEIERAVGEDRSRYVFPKGANDPTVKAIVRKVKAGELTVAKRAGLENVKNKSTKKAAPPVESIDDDEVDEQPAPRRRGRPAKKAAAPAKATKATRTRRTRAAAAE